MDIENIMLFMADGHNCHELLVGVNFVEDPKFPDFQLPPSNRIVAQDLAAVRFGSREAAAAPAGSAPAGAAAAAGARPGASARLEQPGRPRPPS